MSNKVSLKCRVNEFKEEGMIESGSSMMCKYCNKRVDYERKDTITKQCNGQAHIKNRNEVKKNKLKRQMLLEESQERAKKIKSEKCVFIQDTVEAFIDANIPLEKLDEPALRNWMNKYIKGSGDLPKSRTLRLQYIPKLAEENDKKIKEELKGKDVMLLCDEHTDKSGRVIFQILFQTLEPATCQKLFLVSANILDKADSATCSRAILDTLAKYEKNIEEVTVFNADSARYMTKCFKTLQGLHEELQHVQCWPHKLHHAGNTFQTSFPELNKAVANTKKLFLLSNTRKNLYLNFLANKYPDNAEKVHLFPIPVITRWGSWKRGVDYLAQHFSDICEFLDGCHDAYCRNEDEDEYADATSRGDRQKGNKSVTWFNNLTHEEREEIQVLAEYTSVTCEPISKMITLLQSNKIPTGHLVYEKLDTIEREFNLLKEGNILVLSELTFFKSLSVDKQQMYIPKFKLAAQNCHLYLSKLGSKDPARDMFVGLNVLLGPSAVTIQQANEKFISEHMKNIPFIKKLSVKCFMEGQAALIDLARKEVVRPDFKELDVQDLLCSLKTKHIDFSNACLKAMWILPSNADSERSISAYNLIFTDRRRNTKPGNVEILCKAYFNKRYNFEEDI